MDEGGASSGEEGVATAIQHLADRAYMEFDYVSDYIWKAPRLIEAEQTLELEKLEEYFPITGVADHDR